jgi:hypothetical protein
VKPSAHRKCWLCGGLGRVIEDQPRGGKMDITRRRTVPCPICVREDLRETVEKKP